MFHCPWLGSKARERATKLSGHSGIVTGPVSGNNVLCATWWNEEDSVQCHFFYILNEAAVNT